MNLKLCENILNSLPNVEKIKRNCGPHKVYQKTKKE